ncbi:MAG: hypothetical protein OEZ59_00885 [Deltaproteobacteria bacterium]|nr:hypothetical protein [Deltaproteobacteria bacterium]
MTVTTAIMGRGGSGKTFIASHLAMALGSIGVKTLLVGCDQKQDLHRALTTEPVTCLMDELAACNFIHDEIPQEALAFSVSEYVDVMELGASPLLAGSYAAVLEETFLTFDVFNLWKRYDQIIFDINEERFDGSHLQIFRRVDQGLLVVTDEVESFFVANRVLRAVLIGSHEMQTRMRLLGVAGNRLFRRELFDEFVNRTRLFPLLGLPADPALHRLRRARHTFYQMERLPQELKQADLEFIRLADTIKGTVIGVLPFNPLPDEEVWQIEKIVPA